MSTKITKITKPPGPGSYRLKGGVYERLDTPQKPPISATEKQRLAKEKAGKAAASAGDKKQAAAKSPTRPLRGKEKQ